MTEPTPHPEPPYEGVHLPSAFQLLPYDQLPRGMQARVDRATPPVVPPDVPAPE